MTNDTTLVKRLIERANRISAAVLKGGQLQAAFRQGLHEIGLALRAFPDAIQHVEPGTVWNPLYRDTPGKSTSSSVHGAMPGQTGKPPGSVYGDTQASGTGTLPAPSAIAGRQSTQRSKPDQGQDQCKSHARAM